MVQNDTSENSNNSDPEHLLCLDAKTIYYGGGRSQIELCDILTTDNTYIHIKPYSGSAK